MKDEFLNNEIWVLTFGGGFQRANVYKNLEVSQDVRKEFRNGLRIHIEKLVEEQYHQTVSEKAHIANIRSIEDYSKTTQFGGVCIPINFGVAQKLLNLYLKYSWCSGRINSVPVHFPVDRLIQIKLNKEAHKTGLKLFKLKPWTQFEDKEDYNDVIEFAKEVRDKKFSGKTLAEMELEIFTRR
jgi:hypothetical protein